MTATALLGFGKRLGRAALDALLPPLCLSCQAIVDQPGSVCAACWSRLSFMGEPMCRRCGLPFPHDVGAEAECAACIADPPPWERARAVFAYDEASRGLILGFKHADRLHGAPAFGRWLARAGGELARDADIIAPVPLHWLRLALRRYNQAALLAQALAAATGRICIPDLLKRTRRTPSQGHLSRSERQKNVAGAFRARTCHRDQIAGKRVLIVDDVLTTGATVRASTKALLAAGAAQVDIVTLARVVRAE
ncbi:MAG: ComF family protein [Alphaproteobacteria bacterium]|nr:ComF family protein [Alphaproteobacteria bacterium]